jgi:hypothetical protein
MLNVGKQSNDKIKMCQKAIKQGFWQKKPCFYYEKW